ncbi:MAG: hypothetical protein IKM31_07470 [Oscillospiraceae bacterium]|nr:hypothetical protein [Anaerotignum sp.]MBR6790689.1 hypothetical protein [Oscillospiraceae bacterium]
MLYKIGTVQELRNLVLPFPEIVRKEAEGHLAILDSAYGEMRDWRTDGGYVAMLENETDLPLLWELVGRNADVEWAKKVTGETEYAILLFLLGDDYAVIAIMPWEIVPTEIRSQLM